MESRISLLFVTLVITIFFSKTIATEETVCSNLEDGLYTYCKTEDVLTSVTSRKSIINNLFDNLTITDTNIFEIADNAFNNNLQLGELTLHFGFDLLDFNPNAFRGLDNLTILNVYNGRVILKNDAFEKLISLKLLKLEADESSVRLYEFLPNLGNLTELEVLRTGEVKICPPKDSSNKSSTIQIEKLVYTNGRGLKKLKANSLYCLKNLNIFSISQTNLLEIEEGVFDCLEKLENLILTMNKKLKRIPARTFHNFVNSIELDLNSNSIEIIEVGAFNSKRTNFLSIDLSSNKLSIIKTNVFYGVQCEILDLSVNDITTIELFAFNQSKILSLFVFDNPLLQFDGHFSELSIFSTIYITDSLIFIRNKVQFNCTLLDDQNYEICFHKENLKLVREIDHDEIAKDKLSKPTLEISRNITSIEEYTFYNLSISQLIIKSKEETQIDIKPLSLYLPKLEILEFHGSSILLKKNIFKKLTSLIYLSLKVVEENYLLCQLLPELINIKYLKIVDHDKINICDEKCSNNKFKLISLEYAGGNITEIQADAFTCLELDHFTISDTNLKSIKANAFIGLNLKTLSIIGINLMNIPSSIFNNLKQLYVLHINDYFIRRLDNKIDNIVETLNSNENMVLINLNENKLIYSENGSIRHSPWRDIVVSTNEIILTSNVYDYTKKRNHIFLYNTTEFEANNFGKYLSSNHQQFNQSVCSYNSSECTDSKTLPILKTCMNRNGVLISVTNTDPSLLIEKFELDIGCIETIGRYAFMASTIKNELIIKPNVEKLRILKNAFFDMQDLKNLRFDSQVRLNHSIFKNLISLEVLILSIDETNVPLCNVLTDLPSLTKLQIVNYNSISICNERRCKNDDHFEISKLWYNGGTINKIQKESFKCVTLLNFLFITNTNLTTIETDAFYGLNKLQTLSLAYNKITFIHKNIFKHLKKLKELYLQFNYIQEIESTTFQSMRANLLNLNLDFNKFSIIKKNTFTGLKCDSLDLSSNNIRKIEDDAFYNAQIKDLYYFNNPKIDVNLNKIHLTNSTTVHQITGTIFVMKKQSKKNCQLLCENCDFKCETSASKIAENIQNEEKNNYHTFDSHKPSYTKHFVKHTKVVKKCTKYCAKCPEICGLYDGKNPV